MVKITGRLWLALALILASSLPLLAQQTTGNISGRALDPQGAGAFAQEICLERDCVSLHPTLN